MCVCTAGFVVQKEERKNRLLNILSWSAVLVVSDYLMPLDTLHQHLDLILSKDYIVLHYYVLCMKFKHEVTE